MQVSRLVDELQFLSANVKPRYTTTSSLQGSQRSPATIQATSQGLPGYATFYDLGQASFRPPPETGAMTSCGEAICTRQGQVGHVMFCAILAGRVHIAHGIDTQLKMDELNLYLSLRHARTYFFYFLDCIISQPRLTRYNFPLVWAHEL